MSPFPAHQTVGSPGPHVPQLLSSILSAWAQPQHEACLVQASPETLRTLQPGTPPVTDGRELLPSNELTQMGASALKSRGGKILK